MDTIQTVCACWNALPATLAKVPSAGMPALSGADTARGSTGSNSYKCCSQCCKQSQMCTVCMLHTHTCTSIHISVECNLSQCPLAAPWTSRQSVNLIHMQLIRLRQQASLGLVGMAGHHFVHCHCRSLLLKQAPRTMTGSPSRYL